MTIYINPDDITLELVQAATRWLIEFDTLSPEKCAQFEAWLKADPRHAVLYQQAKDIEDKPYGWRGLRGLPPRKEWTPS
jgi:ferric-dicitrate binding protein FerR (iron transport regulator)